MQLVNWAGAVFGPGSEWFWSMAQAVIVGVTLVAIYAQVRLQRSQSAIEHLERYEQEYASERMSRAVLEILYALRDGAKPVDVPRGPAMTLANYWERVGSLARRGHLDIHLLQDGGSGHACQNDWVLLEPTIRDSRATTGNAQILANFEWLADAMTTMGRKAGVPPVTAEWQAARRVATIASYEAQIRIEEALRSPARAAETGG